jgi:hypothetical protein
VHEVVPLGDRSEDLTERSRGGVLADLDGVDDDGDEDDVALHGARRVEQRLRVARAAVAGGRLAGVGRGLGVGPAVSPGVGEGGGISRDARVGGGRSLVPLGRLRPRRLRLHDRGRFDGRLALLQDVDRDRGLALEVLHLDRARQAERHQ